MQDAVTRAYRLSDGVPLQVRAVNGERQIQVGGLTTDPMATVVVVEIDGDTVRR